MADAKTGRKLQIFVAVGEERKVNLSREVVVKGKTAREKICFNSTCDCDHVALVRDHVKRQDGKFT